MKNAVLLFSLFLLVPTCFAQTATQIAECQKAVKKAADSDIPPSICSVVLGPLKPNEHVASVDNSYVMTLTDGILHFYPLPPKLRTTLLLANSKKLFKSMEQEAKLSPFAAAMLASNKDLWEEMRKAYCAYHPGDAYSDLADQQQVCPEADGSAINSTTDAVALKHPAPFSVSPGAAGTKTCQKAITFALAQNGEIVYRLPNVSNKWLDKAERKRPNVCFLQYDARSGQENYLVVLSSSSSAFNGLQPVFLQTTTMEPVSGSGTVTGTQGGTWDFTYQGTTTTTTTAQTNVPYTDTTNHFYANAYKEDGTLVGTSERAASARQGGDPSNAFGYNLTSALLSFHLEEHLLDEIVEKIGNNR